MRPPDGQRRPFGRRSLPEKNHGKDASVKVASLGRAA
jgi:hypothetical protein